MGTAENYEEVLKGKYPAKAHAKKVADWIVAKGGDKTGTIYLEAQKDRLLEVSCCAHIKYYSARTKVWAPSVLRIGHQKPKVSSFCRILY